MAKKQLIEVLAEKGELTNEAVARLKDAWVSNCDELYARMQSCKFAENPEMERAMEKELGIKDGAIDGFMEYVQPYVSDEAINAEKPPEYSLGLKILPKRILTR